MEEDLPLLIQSFFARYRKALHKKIETIEDEAYEWLLNYEWPGNIRELENTMEYLVNIASEDKVSAKHIPQHIKTGSAALPAISGHNGAPLVVPIAELERTAILGAMKKFGTTTEGKEKAANALGISKATLYRKIKEYEDMTKNLSK